ncbi:MAG: hypothetical protein IT381_22730 [Deltaproteobacteria bacterium]|nr:hypothetical protein [Deltaproteobacteria bacterium]
MVKRCLLLLILTACEAPHALRFVVDDREIAAHDAGLVTLTQPRELVFMLDNRSESAVALREPEVRGDAFLLVGDDCGRSLGAGDRCSLRVSFDPLGEREHKASLIVRYVQDEQTREISLPVSGRGRLDCAVGVAMNDARQKGSAAALAENGAQAALGDAAGRALTYDDGYSKRYESASQEGYAAGYADGSYETAYRARYSEGVYAGKNDAHACSDGAAAGDKDGYADGALAGLADGRAAGKSDGYPVGYARGKSDAKDGCESPARDVHSALSSDDPALTGACWKRGYQLSLDPLAQANAYREAAAANAPYQRGRADGFTAGYAVGFAAGDAQAFATGDARGYDDGYRAGADERFAACYDAGYKGGVDDGYDDAATSGYSAGYQDGFDDGYEDGWEDVCG